MSKLTSIHIEACKTASSEKHNKREKVLDYVREELSDRNEYYVFDNRSLEEIKLSCAKRYQEKHGKKLNKRATPVREGVVVIKDDTTKQQLMNFAQEMEKLHGIKLLQLHIHRDEGVWRKMTNTMINEDGEEVPVYDTKQAYEISTKDAEQEGYVWKPNLHAHMVFQWFDHDKGESIKIGKQRLADMQTKLAEHLNMKRGDSSDIKHLNSIQYKNKKKQEEYESTLQMVQRKDEELLYKENRSKALDEEIKQKEKELIGEGVSHVKGIIQKSVDTLAGFNNALGKRNEKKVQEEVEKRMAPIVKEIEEERRSIDIERKAIQEEREKLIHEQERYSVMSSKVVVAETPTYKDARTIELLRSANPKIDEEIAIISDARTINMGDEDIKKVLQGGEAELMELHRIEPGIRLDEPTKFKVLPNLTTGKRVLTGFFKEKYYAIKDFIMKLRNYHTSTEELMQRYKVFLKADTLDAAITKLTISYTTTNENTFKDCLNEYLEITGCNVGTREEIAEKREKAFLKQLKRFEGAISKTSYNNILNKGLTITSDFQRKSGFKPTTYHRDEEQSRGMRR